MRCSCTQEGLVGKWAPVQRRNGEEIVFILLKMASFVYLCLSCLLDSKFSKAQTVLFYVYTVLSAVGSQTWSRLIGTVEI